MVGLMVNTCKVIVIYKIIQSYELVYSKNVTENREMVLGDLPEIFFQHSVEIRLSRQCKFMSEKNCCKTY
jgi:hypothetical protein